MNKKDFNRGETVELRDLSSTVAAAANGPSQPLYRFGVTIKKINLQRFKQVKSDKWPLVVAAGEKWLSRARRSSEAALPMKTSVTGATLIASCAESIALSKLCLSIPLL